MRVFLFALIAGVVLCNVAKADTATIWLDNGSMTVGTGSNPDVFTVTSNGMSMLAGSGQIGGVNTANGLFTVTIDFDNTTHAITGGNLTVGTTSPVSTAFSSTDPISFSYNDAGANSGTPPLPTQYVNFSFIETTTTSYAPAGTVLTGDVEFDPATTAAAIPVNFFSNWTIAAGSANGSLFKGDVNVTPLPATVASLSSLLAVCGFFYMFRKFGSRKCVGV